MADPSNLVSIGGALVPPVLARHPDLHIEQDDYNINVTANFGARLEPHELAREYERHQGASKAAHLYFHFPLCNYVCHFCNYVKMLAPSAGNREEALDRWTEALVEESRRYVERFQWLPQAWVESFYIGGGTAALLGGKQLERLLQHVRTNYALSEDCELTLEGNPDNFCERERVSEAMEVGFNRFSVGVQALDDRVTGFTNRGHDRKMSIQALKILREAGAPFNVDMMFGLPHQTPESVGCDIGLLIEMGAPTITIYRLRNVDRQAMGIGKRALWNVPRVREKMHRDGVFPSLSTTYQMRDAAVEQLLNHGYFPSPCGWWSAPGTYRYGNIPRVSRNKWQRQDTMIALGPGAYGWLTGGEPTIFQTHNDSDIHRYLKTIEESDDLPLAFGRRLEGLEAVATALGFAYKANQPIQLERFRQQFGIDLLRDEPCKGVFEDLESKGLVERLSNEDAVRPTLEGEALHEEVISRYLHGAIGSFSEPVCRRA